MLAFGAPERAAGAAAPWRLEPALLREVSAHYPRFAQRHAAHLLELARASDRAARRRRRRGARERAEAGASARLGTCARSARAPRLRAACAEGIRELAIDLGDG